METENESSDSPSAEAQARTIRIFISSPGDVKPEREKARQVVAQLQKYYGSAVSLVPVL